MQSTYARYGLEARQINELGRRKDMFHKNVSSHYYYLNEPHVRQNPPAATLSGEPSAVTTKVVMLGWEVIHVCLSCNTGGDT